MRHGGAAAVAVGTLCFALYAGCGEEQKTESGAFSETETVAFSLQGGSSGELTETVAALEERAQSLGIDNVEIDTVGSDRIEVTVPEGEQERAAALGVPAELTFYDWEANVIGDAADAGERPLNSLGDAEELAAQNPGTIVVEAEDGRGYFVIRDRPALTGDDIVDPDQTVDPITNEPALSFHFTDPGVESFELLTRQIAERGRKSGEPSHFAVILDEELVSLPTIDPKQNPHGFDAENGALIQGTFTIQEAQDLASLLEIGPLPLELEPVE